MALAAATSVPRLWQPELQASWQMKTAPLAAPQMGGPPQERWPSDASLQSDLPSRPSKQDDTDSWILGTKGGCAPLPAFFLLGLQHSPRQFILDMMVSTPSVVRAAAVTGIQFIMWLQTIGIFAGFAVLMSLLGGNFVAFMACADCLCCQQGSGLTWTWVHGTLQWAVALGFLLPQVGWSLPTPVVGAAAADHALLLLCEGGGDRPTWALCLLALGCTAAVGELLEGPPGLSAWLLAMSGLRSAVKLLDWRVHRSAEEDPEVEEAPEPPVQEREVPLSELAAQAVRVVLEKKSGKLEKKPAVQRQRTPPPVPLDFKPFQQDGQACRATSHPQHHDQGQRRWTDTRSATGAPIISLWQPRKEPLGFKAVKLAAAGGKENVFLGELKMKQETLLARRVHQHSGLQGLNCLQGVQDRTAGSLQGAGGVRQWQQSTAKMYVDEEFRGGETPGCTEQHCKPTSSSANEAMLHAFFNSVESEHSAAKEALQQRRELIRRMRSGWTSGQSSTLCAAFTSKDFLRNSGVALATMERLVSDQSVMATELRLEAATASLLLALQVAQHDDNLKNKQRAAVQSVRCSLDALTARNQGCLMRGPGYPGSCWRAQWALKALGRLASFVRQTPSGAALEENLRSLLLEEPRASHRKASEA